jgi:hypothetical protein
MPENLPDGLLSLAHFLKQDRQPFGLRVSKLVAEFHRVTLSDGGSSNPVSRSVGSVVRVTCAGGVASMRRTTAIFTMISSVVSVG